MSAKIIPFKKMKNNTRKKAIDEMSFEEKLHAVACMIEAELKAKDDKELKELIKEAEVNHE